MRSSTVVSGAGCCTFLLCVVASCGKSPPAGSPPRKTPTAQNLEHHSQPVAEPKLLPQKKLAAGWIQLFDSQTLFGWKANSNANWRVAEGIITADDGGPGLLVTNVPFADFEFQCDFRLEEGGNSGVFLRTTFDPRDPGRDCYELNMCDSHKTHPTGSLVARQVADVQSSGEGEWKRWHVVARGRRIIARLDGRTVLDFTDKTKQFRSQGFIGLQKRDGKIEFQRILLRPATLQPVFDGMDLTGWTETPGSKARIAVENGAIRLKGGPGYLESEREFGDFVLQFDVKTNAARVNSGLFFRTIAGSNPADGYELQVHNGFTDGDRSRPDDYGSGFGTGAIFRRQKARRVVSNDQQWTAVTLIASGADFATWVNGYQTTSWTDLRAAHDNPRKGLRKGAGRLSLQAHDPQCDVEFRRLRVAEYPR